MKKSTTLFFLIISLVLTFINKANAQKIDTIYHINGNVMTGDFKKMVYGVVKWKMDGMGTINLEEVKIKSIISKKEFEIKMNNEVIYFGSIKASEEPRKVYIVTKDEVIHINIADIVEIYPIKNTAWSRLSGSFSLGANFSKGSDIGTVVFSGNLDYRMKKSYFDLSWSNNLAYQGDTISSSKTDVDIAWQRLQKNGWSSQIGIGMNQNSELGTKLRVGTNITEIKNISYNNWNRLYAGAGLNITRETPYGGGETKNDLAGIFQVVWKVYKYTIPKVWVDANISIFPYITNSGRYITTLNLNPSISVFADNFKVGFKFYYNYDSKPAETYSTNDYGLNLTLTYSFH